MSDYKLIDITRLTKFKDKLLGILTYSSPATNTSSTSIEFIDTVSQTNGKINATKKKVSTFAGNTAGLVPAPGTNASGTFLGSNGQWSKPTGTTYSNYAYSTNTKAGATGLVPAPGTGDAGKFLKGGSGWSDLPTASTTQTGVVQLVDNLNSNDDTKALTAKQGSKLLRFFDNFISEADFTSPTVSSGTTISFIDTVSQSNGKIRATKKNIPAFAGSSQPGIVYAPEETSLLCLLDSNGEWTQIDERLSTVSGDPVQNNIVTSNINGTFCYSDASDLVKEVNMPGFDLYKGAMVKVLFKNACTISYPKLKVGNTAAKTIMAYRGGRPVNSSGLKASSGKWRGAASAFNEVWQPYTILELMYDGDNWVIMGNPVIENFLGTDFGYEKYADGLIKQWGHVENTGYIGVSLTIGFISYTSKDSYCFNLFGIDSEFGTSTNEIASQKWDKSSNSITYKTRQRDFPKYKSFDWYTIGY